MGENNPPTPPPVSSAVEINALWVEAVAQRVVQLMRGETISTSNGGRLVDAATLADELGVDRSWVYEHRDELGAIRLGTGSKPRLRFDVPVAREALIRRATTEPVSPAPGKGRGRRPSARGESQQRRQG